MSEPVYTVELLADDTLGQERFDEINGDVHDPFETDGLGLKWADKKVHYVVRANGRLVAHAGLVDVPVTVGGRDFDTAGLGTVIVSAEHRGNGLARTVVGAAMEHARREGHAYGLLFCLESRVGLYERLGWRPVDGEVTVEQPEGPVVMSLRTMWLPLQEDAEWPAGAVRLRSLPM